MSATGTVPAKEETTFYSDDGGVRVTSARLVIGPTTYAMLNVTSVMRAEERPSRVGPVLMSVVGVMFFLVGLSGAEHGGAVFGVVLLAVGVLWWRGQRTKYHLRISSASGEANAVTDFNRQRIDNIIQGVNEAIIGRG
jgi:hypothetical protein